MDMDEKPTCGREKLTRKQDTTYDCQPVCDTTKQNRNKTNGIKKGIKIIKK